MMEMITNPFGGSTPLARKAGTEAIVARESQETQAMVAVAQRFPRNPMKSMDRILQACTRQGLAESSVYQYQRGGTDISGPSIRLAEAIAQSWGNIQFGYREVNRGENNGVGFSEVEAFAWDLETNTRKPAQFIVKHWRDKKNGGGYALKDERDIYELIANLASRRVRNCILALIPGDVVDAAVRQCDLTMKASADVTKESIQKMIDVFAEFGVTKKNIEQRIQRRIDSITPALMVQMKKIFASLRDGMSSPSDWFEMDVKAEGSATSYLPPPAGMNPETGEISEAAQAEHVDQCAELLMLIEEAQSVADLDALSKDIGRLRNNERTRVVTAWKARKAAISAPVVETTASREV